MKQLHPLNFAKFQGLLFALLGILAGVVYAFGGFIIDAGVTFGWFTSEETPGLSSGTLLAFGALLGMPIIFYIIGLVTGFVQAVLFNIVERLLGRKFKAIQIWKTKN